MRAMWTYIYFFNDTATTEIYTLSLHDALPISPYGGGGPTLHIRATLKAEADERMVYTERVQDLPATAEAGESDRKSTRLNSSHANISYAVFCLKKNTRHALSIDAFSWLWPDVS